MNRFVRGEPCPKCHGHESKIAWHPAGLAKVKVDERPKQMPERLRVECADCGYFWLRSPLDATGETPDA